MSEKTRIGEYKGFELWDTPAPEGWRVHSYPVQVTCNGEHVNCFADANEAMSVIDGMDADTIAYHMRQLPPAPAEPTGDGAVDVSPSIFDGIERRIMKAGDVRFLEGIDEPIGLETAKYINHQSMALHNEKAVSLAFAQDADELRKQLAAAQAERDAAIQALTPFAKIYERWLKRLIEDQYFPEWLEIHLTVKEQEGWYTRQWFEAAAKAVEDKATSE